MSQLGSLPGNRGCDTSTSLSLVNCKLQSEVITLMMLENIGGGVNGAIINVSKGSGTSGRAAAHNELNKLFPPSCVSDLSPSCSLIIGCALCSCRALKALQAILDVSFSCHHILVSVGREIKKNVKMASCHMPDSKISLLLTILLIFAVIK